MRRRFALGARSGSVAVETALVGAAFVALATGIVEAGRAFYALDQLETAVEVAARAALLDRGRDYEELAVIARAALAGDAVDVSVTVRETLEGGVAVRTIVASRPMRLHALNIAETGLTLTASRRLP